MSEKYEAIVLIGMPGTGKGTQGRIIGRVPGFHYFSSGDMFRALDPTTETGRVVHDRISRGELVSDDLVISLWKEHLEQAIAAGRFHPERDVLILDGLPRTVPQAEMLEAHGDVRTVLSLGCADEQELLARMLRRAQKEGRADDQTSVIRRRLEIFHEQTAPVLAHYPKTLIAEINALQTPLEVLAAIVEVLIPLQLEQP